MKRFPILLLCILLTAGCVTTPPTTTADPMPGVTQSTQGSSYQTAIVIKEQSELTGVPAEYAWLKANRPGWKAVGQALASHNGRPYDILTIRKGGKTEEIYFDISNFFGKL